MGGMGLPLWAVGMVAALTSGAATLLLLPILRRRVIDVPNERSSHDTPVPRAGGLPILIGLVGALGAGSVTQGLDTEILIGVGILTFLAAVGFRDDLKSLGVRFRLLAQLAAGIGMVALVQPAWWMSAVLIVFVVGQVNATNFMDGINGLTGMSAALTASWHLYLLNTVGAPDWSLVAAATLGSVVPFLVWNLRGRLFLGDVGSYLLGGVTALLTIVAWSSGAEWYLALAPLTIGVVDTMTTVILRLISGQKIGEPHRGHAYQLMTQKGYSHASVATMVLVANALICVIALAAAQTRLELLLLAVAVCSLYVIVPRRGSPR